MHLHKILAVVYRAAHSAEIWAELMGVDMPSVGTMGYGCRGGEGVWSRHVPYVSNHCGKD